MLVLGLLAFVQPPAAAAVSTKVSINFDGNAISQYTLGYQQALLPHSDTATFYVNSGTVGGSANFMSWAQLSTLAVAGNDIGGKSVNATNLTTDPNPTAQVCNDRATIIQHGLKPVGFAYPGGASNATVKTIVKNCGYGNARTAGSLSPTGPTYAETAPPADWYGVRAYAPSHPTLANLQSLVNGASAHGGGWINVVVGKVCSQSLDPTNYSTCGTSSGSMELGDLNSFLDWMTPGGGAPTGAALANVSSAVSAVDTSAPTSTITCNGAPCASTPYPDLVSVALSSTDTGTGVASIHYTTDGTTPTLNSPTYTGPFNVNGSSQSTTVSFAAWDYGGNAEAPNTQTILAPPDTAAPVTSITCNSTSCTTSAYVATVTVALAATDTGGSGVASTYYTTDGSTPTSANPYSAPFTINAPGTYTVKFFSTDKAGNAEAVQTQQLKVVPVTTRVMLTFDNGNVSQFDLGYKQALQPHAANATFFVNTSSISKSANSMTWDELATLNSAGNDVGGKTGSTDLTTETDPATLICNDRKNLVQHGLTAEAFAYPGGRFNSTIEAAVKNCGYGTARTAGSLSPTGPTYAESVPPKDWYATRAWAPGGQISESAMQNLVTGAAGHGGGWSQIVINRVCSQAQDPANYASCTASGGWIELADLNTFLDWMANAGQSGGAPAGAMLSSVLDAAKSADTTSPVTTASCGDAACPTGTQTTTTYVSLAATDVGSGVASTHYTLDGSAPTLSSPTYTAPIPITRTTTVTYASWDNAGNTESPNTLTINANLATDTTPPSTAIQCDGAPCQLGADGGYNGKTTVTLVASDGTGWGVDKTYYTLDGSTPTTSSAVYNGPITLSTAGTYTVQAFSVDLAGNQESVQSQQITILPAKVIVSLTFDDGVENQYSLGYLRALKPHNMHGTFYDVSGANNVDPQHMTWAQLHAVNNGGNEIGGHTVDHVNLKTQTDTTYIQHEVCQDRQNLIAQGFDPVSFAYPEGAYNATDESIVQGCGYTTARAAGGIDVAGDGAGPVYAETVPPLDPYATRTGYDPPTGNPPNVAPLSLSHLESQVTGAAQHGGGWIAVVLHQVCSQTLDPDNYASCISDWGPIELNTLNAFLDWLQQSGQAGGAPARTAVETVRQVMAGPDTQPPVTTLECDGSPCGATTYSGSTLVSLKANDPGGSGIAGTYYTTDGSTPTTSSPIFTQPFAINSPTTFKFFSVDNSGNVEPVQSLQVNVTPNADPVIGAAGDIACDPNQIAYNDGQGTATDCRAIHTVDLLKGVDAVLPLGDDQYYCGGTQAFAQSYNTSWGQVKSITHPVPGDQDYNTTGGTDCPSVAGAGYFQYFGAAAGDPSKGYYSYNLGQWHVVALNTAPCGNDPTFCAAGSAQEQWLKQDLAANSSSCTLAYYQNPRWVSAAGGGNTTYQALWQQLYDGGTDVVLNGDSHWYERFAPQDGAGKLDAAHGVREFIVGTGGQGLDTPGATAANSQVLDDTTHGVIKLTLHAGSYDWSFVPDEGTFTDSGTATCHGAPDSIAPTTTISCNSGPCGTGFAGSAVQVGLTAVDNPKGSGVDKTYYTTDGSTPTTASSVYSAPFAVSSTATVKYYSVDKAGNAEAVQTQQIKVDTAAPTTTATCNGASCAGWYNVPVQLALSATDPNGSGVDKTYYTTDGSTPTTSSSVYTGPITVSSTTTVKFFSVDLSGNAEPVNTQQVQVDSNAPSTSATCNGTTCAAGWYTAPVQFALNATDAGGSGVAKTYYTTDGSTPTTSSAVYNSALTLSAQATVKWFSVDTAGNAETMQSQLVQVDTTAPTTTATCNGATCSGWYTAPVAVALTASDSGGSGVAKTYYTTDGSTPTTSSTPYSTAFTVGSTSAVKYISVDSAGNVSPVATTTVQVDTTAPTSTSACNGAPCTTSAYAGSVTFTLSGSDTGGSGVAAIRYTTDGTTPTTSSPAYTSALTITRTTTVRFRAWDVAGNAEGTTHSVTVTVLDNAPAVSFTLTPSTGVAPVSVQADASASTDTDNSPISTYRFAWGDGSAAVTQAGATATHNYTKTGTFTVTVTVTDTAGLSTSATKTVVSKANLINNSGFESNTNGWSSSTPGVGLTRVRGGHSGTFAGALTNNNSTGSANAVLVGSPAFVKTTSAGTYAATMWVKGQVAGGTLQLALTETDSTGAVVGSASTPVTLTTSWQQVSVSYPVKRPGLTSLTLSATLPSVPARTVGFYADDATLSL